MRTLLLALALSAVEALPLHAVETGSVDRGKAAAKSGDWEAAADHFADALFADEKSPEVRDLLRTAAAQVMEQRTDWIQRERARVLFRLGLGPEPPAEPQKLPMAVARKLGPSTLELTKRRPSKRRVAVLETAQPVAPPERVPTPNDREMAKFHYFQGLRAYADNEIQEAKQAWRRALELDPQMERAKNALGRLK